MRFRGMFIVALVFIVCFGTAVGAESAQKMRRGITALSEINLKSGVNVVSFVGLNMRAVIIVAYYDNGNAHGHARGMVMARSSHQPEVWSLVPIRHEHDPVFEDTVRDHPFTGENNIKTVRFFNGKLNGIPTTLLITAERNLRDVQAFSDPALVSISVYRLVRATEPGPEGYFEPVARVVSTRRYCNADTALHNELSIRLPSNYAAPNDDDGCWQH